MLRFFICPEGATENSQGQRPWTRAMRISVVSPNGARDFGRAVRMYVPAPRWG